MVALLLVGSVVGLVLQLADSGPRWSPCPLGRAGTRQPLSDGPAGLWGALRTREESPRRAQTSRSSGGATHSQVCHPQPTLRCPPTIAGSTREAPSDGAVGGHGAGARWADRCGCQPPSHRNALRPRTTRGCAPLVERGERGNRRRRHHEFWRRHHEFWRTCTSFAGCTIQ